MYRAQAGHNGIVVWFTGLSSAGKTTICEAVYTELLASGVRAEMLDGDTFRQHLNRDLGFSKEDRDENVRRLGFVARLLARHGVVVLVSAISPYRKVRDEIRASVETFLEVYVNAPLHICEARDVKGLYRKARLGLIQQFTGIDDPYEPPLSPEIECQTDLQSVRQCVESVIDGIGKRLGKAPE